MEDRRGGGQLGLVETVRCLECGEVYAKPSGGGTMKTNPGCPRCGYVGWLPVGPPAAHGLSRHRISGRRPFPLVRLG